MKKNYTVWILLIGISLGIVEGGGLDCIHSEECECYKSSELEYQCPKNDFEIILHTIPGKYVIIDCYKSIPEYNLTYFPNLNMGDLEYFSMRFCPLPRSSFNFTLEKFKINTIKFMELEEAINSDDQTRNVTKELFYGLSDLEKLSISLFKIKLDEDFLDYLPNLITLYLDNNEIQEIGPNMFKHVPKLRVLHLSRNLISRIPDGVFENLSDLQQLHLWKNRLTALDRKSFHGLGQLKSLELSGNNISSLAEDTFAELGQLVNISLRTNNLHILPANIFKRNLALEGIRLGYNPNINLSDYVFANLTYLLRVNIDNSNLINLPEHIFEGCTNLTTISLENNNIFELTETVFKDVANLNALSLKGNKIKTIYNNTFSSLKNLEVLNLEANEIEEINDIVFRELKSLKILNLRQNRITEINLLAFSTLMELIELDLSYNGYYNEESILGVNPFNCCNKLKKVNLSHNKIQVFPENIMISKTQLVSLDLDYNNITAIRMADVVKVSQAEVEVRLNNNNVSILDFREIKLISKMNTEQYDALHNRDTRTILYLMHNPIRCDCYNFDLIQYMNDKIDPVVQTLVDIQIGNLHCAAPKSFKHIPIRELKPYQVTCPVADEGCPQECGCDYRPFDAHVVVDCSYRNLTKAPSLNFIEMRNMLEVNLDGNLLETTPKEKLGYERVTKLHLSNNHISSIDWIPPEIEVLNLDRNQMKLIEPEILEILNHSKTLQNLTLYDNPWSCGCSALGLQNYLRSHFTKVKPTDVICEDNEKPLIDRKELCKSKLTIIMTIAVPILILLFASATVVAIYFYYQEQIKVWLYAKNLCLWFVTEEELDKDKTYDVFISYSHKDEDFVLQNLLPVLEQGPNPFKVCIHIRDWIPGEFIANQVTNSVLDSRRTLVVLSESFLESVWGKMEFRTAHTQAISDGRARVIILKYGDINEEKLDNELKSYLKTNTYIEWGDPWFWNKLKYALPHSRQNKFHNNNQKHANMMLKIDDKFELTSSPVHAESTPPAISLDPSLLKDHPLNFRNGNGTIPSTDIPLIAR